MNSKNKLSLLLAMIFVLLAVVGCVSKGDQTESSSSGPVSSESGLEQSSLESTISETTLKPGSGTESSSPGQNETETKAQTGLREITDMAGRTMSIPKEIKSVYTTSPAASIFLYTISPDRLLGWNYQLNDLEKAIVLEKYHDLPVFGMRDAVNYEAIIAAAPDIALNVGTPGPQIIEESDALAEKLGIPVIVIDGELSEVAKAYTFLGDLLSEEEQAKRLADYSDKTFSDIASMKISDDQKVTLYYGNGEDSLETAPKGSAHAQIIDLVNAINVADLELGDGSRVQISAEQLLAWDPDVIVVNGEPKSNRSGYKAASDILNDPTYASLKAVKSEKVYGIPNAPFGWVDRPPGPNRIIGIRWLSGVLYQDQLNFDVDDQVKEFFQLFYHVELSDQKLEQLYSGTLGE